MREMKINGSVLISDMAETGIRACLTLLKSIPHLH